VLGEALQADLDHHVDSGALAHLAIERVGEVNVGARLRDDPLASDPRDRLHRGAVPDRPGARESLPRRLERVVRDRHPLGRVALRGAHPLAAQIEARFRVELHHLGELFPRESERAEHVGHGHPAGRVHRDPLGRRPVAEQPREPLARVGVV
jgi:hypothetical protein